MSCTQNKTPQKSAHTDFSPTGLRNVYPHAHICTPREHHCTRFSPKKAVDFTEEPPSRAQVRPLFMFFKSRAGTQQRGFSTDGARHRCRSGVGGARTKLQLGPVGKKKDEFKCLWKNEWVEKKKDTDLLVVLCKVCFKRRKLDFHVKRKTMKNIPWDVFISSCNYVKKWVKRRQNFKKTVGLFNHFHLFILTFAEFQN